MDLVKASFDDCDFLNSIIFNEFSYTSPSVKKIKLRLSIPSLYIFKVVEDNEDVGFFELESVSSNIIRLNGLAVLPNFRNRGIGSFLLNSAIEFAKLNNFSEMVLLVKKDNLSAKNLYLKFGFVFSGLHSALIDDCVVEKYSLSLTGVRGI